MMAVFEDIVDEIMSRQGMAAMAKMRPVIEKEVLHYDIFQALDSANLLKNLVFQGGTSLRLCRGSNRFSEDIDFAGGVEFNSIQLKMLKDAIESYVGGRYGLLVSVKEPKARRKDGEFGIIVDKWQVSVETSPAQKDLPRQKIKIDVANVPAYTSELMPLKVNYPSLSGYSGSIFVRAETMDEVLADKVLAFPSCVKMIRHRDIWDIAWLSQQNAKLNPDLVHKKIVDYGTGSEKYLDLLGTAIKRLPEIVNSKEFVSQMSRFIDSATMARTIEIPEFKSYLTTAVRTVFSDMLESMKPTAGSRYRM